MRTKVLMVAASAVVLVIAGVVFASAFTKPQPTVTQGYICPVTGEELPCPSCCPYRDQAAEQSASDCCYDPACPPGCCPECPPDCCPPCPFCP